MTLHDLRALTQYWRHTPPVHVSVAGYLGIGKKERKAPPTEREIASELTAIAGPARGAFVPPIPIRPASH